MQSSLVRTALPPLNHRRDLVTRRVSFRNPSKANIRKLNIRMAGEAAAASSFWDGISSIYQLFIPIAAHFNGRAFDLVKPRLSTDSPFILDLACGNGLFAMEAARALPNATVLGADISENQIAGAKERATQAELGNLEFKVMDGQDLTALPDDSVDAIVCMFGVMYFGDQDKSWREMYRVLKPGAVAVIGTWNEPPFINFYEAAYAKVRGSDEVVQLPAFAESRNLQDPDRLRSQALSAGPFSDFHTSMEECVWKPWPVAETATGVEKMLATPIFGPPADVDAEDFKAAMTQLISASVSDEGTAALPCKAVMAVATK